MKCKVIKCDLCHKEIDSIDGVAELIIHRNTLAYPGDHYRDREKLHICVSCQDKFIKIFEDDSDE